MLDNSGEKDDQALLNCARPVITSEDDVDLENLRLQLVDAGNCLRARRLIEEIKDNPGV